MPIAFLMPLVQMLFSALKTDAEIRAFPPTFWPKHPTLSGLQALFTESDVLRWIMNTVIVSGTAIASHMVPVFARGLRLRAAEVRRSQCRLHPRFRHDPDPDPTADHPHLHHVQQAAPGRHARRDDAPLADVGLRRLPHATVLPLLAAGTRRGRRARRVLAVRRLLASHPPAGQAGSRDPWPSSPCSGRGTT